MDKFYKGEEFFVPYYEVKVGSSLLPREIVRDVLRVTYKDSIDSIDNFELVINNWDENTRKFKYSDGDVFLPGEKVELWMGYYGSTNERKMITGEITSLRPTFPASGASTLSVSGLNLLQKFRKKQESRAYMGRTDTQIAKQIGASLGLKVRVDANASAQETPYKYLLQRNEYDIIFLLHRARRIGYDLFVEEDSGSPSLYFGPSGKIKQTVHTMTYNKTLIQFTPNLTTANQVKKVTVRGWDPTQKKVIEGTAERNQIATRPLSAAGNRSAIEQAFAQREEIITDRPIESKFEAEQLARETLENNAKDMVKGTGSTVGLPNLRAGTMVEIDGLGKRFAGKYFVMSSTHSIGNNGYTTQFECRRE